MVDMPAAASMPPPLTAMPIGRAASIGADTGRRDASRAWRWAQMAAWVGGVVVIGALLVAPEVGIDLLWNGLVPAAPLLIAFAPGLWRNVCPLATTATLARKLRISRRRRPSMALQSTFAVSALVVMFTVIMLRHVIFDLDGPATGILLLGVAGVAIGVGALFEWKSGWCTGLCPMHPAERLYGMRPAVTTRNAHCTACSRCVTICADSTPALPPFAMKRHLAQRVAAVVLVGGMPGFIVAWFQVPDYANGAGWQHLDLALGLPLVGLVASVLLYLVARAIVPRSRRDWVARTFAAGALIAYYWFRLPALLGFAIHADDGVLVDVSATLPAWSEWALRLAVVALFGWWLLRRAPARSWQVRPTTKRATLTFRTEAAGTGTTTVTAAQTRPRAATSSGALPVVA